MAADDECWDVFGDSDDDDDRENDDEPQNFIKACEAGALYLTQHFLRANAQVPLSQRRVAGGMSHFHEALVKRGMKHVTLDIANEKCWDAAIVIGSSAGVTLTPTTIEQARSLRRGVVSGGILICMDSSAESCMNELDARVWDINDAQTIYNCSELMLVALVKHACPINETACRWKPSSCTLNHERTLLRQATVTRSASEICQNSRLTEAGLQQAVKALQTHGYCIVRNLLDKEQSLEWGNAVIQDFDAAANILKERDGVDLRHPQSSQNNPSSYREMAMREDLRVDLRDGPNLQRLRSQEEEHLEKWSIDASTAAGPVITTTEGGMESFLRFQPDVLEIVKRTMNPKEDNLYRGNWGRYNFEGTGPDGSFQPIRIGPMGGILSLPGSADQAIHADTPHLFEHADCLPAHYINAFALGATISGVCDNDGSFAGSTTVGGTAFVQGSHRLSVTAGFANEDSDGAVSEEREKMLHNLVRPSLQLGDVLLFDCRILHFGLANSSESIERPMLYVNMTHAWFHDPKNWDERKRIFD